MQEGGDVAEGLALAAQHAQRPGRLGGDVEGIAQRQPRRHFEAVLEIGVTLAAHRQIDGDEQRGAAGGLGAGDDLLAEAAVAEHVELKPERPLDRRAYVLDRADRHRRLAIADAGVLGGARRHHLAVAVQKAGKAGRRDGDRHRHVFAEHGRRELALAGVDQDALAEADRFQLCRIGAVADLVIGAGVDIVEQRLRHLAPREPAQVLDVGDDRHSGAPRLRLSAARGTGRSCGSARDRTARSLRSASGAMPRPCSVRPCVTAASDTTLSVRSSSTWSGVSSGVGMNCIRLACSLATRNGIGTSRRRRSMVARMYSSISRNVRTSGPPSS